MAIEIKEFCPLGHECESIKDNTLYRCKWYKHVAGKHPQSEEIIDEWDCAVAWGPTLMTEVAQTNRGQTHALESFRNETVKIGKARNRLLVGKKDD